MVQRVLKLSALDAHARFEACVPPVNGCVSDALLNAAVQNAIPVLSRNIVMILKTLAALTNI